MKWVNGWFVHTESGKLLAEMPDPCCLYPVSAMFVKQMWKVMLKTKACVKRY